MQDIISTDFYCFSEIMKQLVFDYLLFYVLENENGYNFDLENSTVEVSK